MNSINYLRYHLLLGFLVFLSGFLSAQSNPVSLSADEAGANFEWYRNGTLISGANGSTFQANEIGTYWVAFDPTATSCTDTAYNYFHIFIDEGTQTANLNAPTGATSVQWLEDGTIMSGETNSTLVIDNADEHKYYANYQGVDCELTSDSIQVLILDVNQPSVVETPLIVLENESVDACFSIVDGDPNESFTIETCSPDLAADNGTFTSSIVSGELCISYTPNTGFSGTDSFCISVCDQYDLCDEVVVAVTVLPKLEDPIFNDTLVYETDTTICLNNEWVTGPITVSGACGQSSAIGGTITFNDNCFTYTAPSTIDRSAIDSFCVLVCDTNTICDTILYKIPVAVPTLQLKALLQGALFSGAGPGLVSDSIMRDDLRSNNMIPNTEPYTNISNYAQVNSGSETVLSGAFDARGNDSVVDWILVQLRSTSDSSVTQSYNALLQRDGDIVGLNGIDPIILPSGFYEDDYLISVRHRNHFGTMTSQAINVTKEGLVFDFTDLNSDLYIRSNTSYDYTGLAQFQTSTTNALWAGNPNSDSKIKYQGSNNDVNFIFNDVVSFQPNNILYNYDLGNGYMTGDLNLDGKVKYQGNNNDSNILFRQIINYPLNLNFLAQFDFFIEQLPN